MKKKDKEFWESEEVLGIWSGMTSQKEEKQG